MIYHIHTPADFNTPIDELLAHYPKGEIVLLRGDLGSGKTTFTQEFAKVLEITQPITSPTFGVMNHYSGNKGELYHYDIYNKTYNEFVSLGLMETFENNGWHLVEWGSEEFGQLLNLYGYSFVVVSLNIKENQREMEVVYA
jgi:tRNA threonylcarbamoyladenosine biosynthesis protein TsaE